MDAPRVRRTDGRAIVPKLGLEQKTTGRLVAARGRLTAAATQGGAGRAGFKGASEGNLDSSAESDDTEHARHFDSPSCLFGLRMYVIKLYFYFR